MNTTFMGQMGTRCKAWTVGIAVALMAQGSFAAPTTDFKQLLADPGAFQGKRVTLIGVAEIGGDEFFLYPDERARKLAESAVFIARSPGAPTYEGFNNHWLKVTGIVNANAHGPLGSEPCEVQLERVESLPLPPVPDINIYGVFRNDTADTVTLKVAAPTGYSIFDVQPYSTTPPGSISRGSVEVRTPSGQLIVRADLVPRKSQEQFFDTVRRAYYYRIVDRRVELVPPNQTKEWNIYWPPGIGNSPK